MINLNEGIDVNLLSKDLVSFITVVNVRGIMQSYLTARMMDRWIMDFNAQVVAILNRNVIKLDATQVKVLGQNLCRIRQHVLVTRVRDNYEDNYAGVFEHLLKEGEQVID